MNQVGLTQLVKNFLIPIFDSHGYKKKKTKIQWNKKRVCTKG